jgi:hypothetical protein
MLPIVNAFTSCRDSKVLEARMALEFWTLDMEHLIRFMRMERAIVKFDPALATVCMEWLDEYCHWDLAK